MNDALLRIRTELENTYDIPFRVREEQVNGEPAFFMEPETNEDEFFGIRVSFRNQIRMTAEFVPGKYSAEFIRSMANHPPEHRDLFLKFATLMLDRGGKVTIAIDGNIVTFEQFRSLENSWNSLSVKVTKVPMTDNDTFSYSAIAQEWGSLMMGMILSLADIVPINDDDIDFPAPRQAEGKLIRETHNRYERSRINRKLCLERRGYSCCICGFNFEHTYGDIGHNFIHVHHIVPVSQLGGEYTIDPETDLIPVCPNCHAMLHRKNPPYLPVELKIILSNYS